MLHPLSRRPLATAVALGVVAYAAGLGGAWAATTWRDAVVPVPGPLSAVHSLWAALQQDGSPLPPAQPAPSAQPAPATTSAAAPATHGASATPTAAPSPVTTLPPPTIHAPNPVTVTLQIDGTPHILGGVTFFYTWQRSGATSVVVSWTGVSGICLHITANDGHQTKTADPCPTGSSFEFTAAPGGSPNASMTYTVSGSPHP